MFITKNYNWENAAENVCIGASYFGIFAAKCPFKRLFSCARWNKSELKAPLMTENESPPAAQFRNPARLFPAACLLAGGQPKCVEMTPPGRQRFSFISLLPDRRLADIG